MYRGHSCRSTRLRLHARAALLQAIFRGHRQRATYSALQAAVVRIQARLRGYLHCRVRRTILARQILRCAGTVKAIAAAKIAQAYRISVYNRRIRGGVLAAMRTYLLAYRATQIQRWWMARRHNARTLSALLSAVRGGLEQHRAAAMVQRCLRRARVGRNLAMAVSLHMRWKAATRFAKVWRGWVVRVRGFACRGGKERVGLLRTFPSPGPFPYPNIYREGAGCRRPEGMSFHVNFGMPVNGRIYRNDKS